MSGVILKKSVFSLGVCVPASWTDEQVERWANHAYPAVTSAGWQVRKEGDRLVTPESPERAQCEQEPDRVHLVLDA